MIVAFSICITIVVGLIATIIVLASGTQGVGTSVSVLYVATDIEGTVSAKYSKVNKNTSAVISTTDMVTSSGSKTVSFLSTAPTTTSLLNPTESNIALTAEQDLIITYTFTAVETYYATLEYKDGSTSASNIEFSYALNDGAYSDEMSMPIEVTPDHSTTYSIKLHIANTARNASLSGSLNWALTKDGSQTPSGGDDIDTVSLSYANNEGSVINSNTVTFKKNADGTKFKIVGPTPIIDSTSTTSYLNGSFDERTITATGKVSSIDDLINNNGDEFFFFCTDSAVVGTSQYMPSEVTQVYYTSTADNTLESWYDIPTSDLTLYSCFITTNYKAEEKYVSNDIYAKIYVSNYVSKIIDKAFESVSLIGILFPQSLTYVGTENFSVDYFGEKLIIFPNSVREVSEYAFTFSQGDVYNTSFAVCFGNGITEIAKELFRSFDKYLNGIYLGCNLKNIGAYAFQNTGIKTVAVPKSVEIIGESSFLYCDNLTTVFFEDPTSIWIITDDSGNTVADNVSVSDPVQNVTYLTSTYAGYTWTKNS